MPFPRKLISVKCKYINWKPAECVSKPSVWAKPFNWTRIFMNGENKEPLLQKQLKNHNLTNVKLLNLRSQWSPRLSFILKHIHNNRHVYTYTLQFPNSSTRVTMETSTLGTITWSPPAHQFRKRARGVWADASDNGTLTDASMEEISVDAGLLTRPSARWDILAGPWPFCHRGGVWRELAFSVIAERICIEKCPCS